MNWSVQELTPIKCLKSYNLLGRVTLQLFGVKTHGVSSAVLESGQAKTSELQQL